MTDPQQPGNANHINVTGGISGQMAVGHSIQQTYTNTNNAPQPEISAADLQVLRQMVANLKQQVTTAAPPEQQQAALERLNELEEAVTTSKPDLSTMEYVKRWFSKNLPALSGAVTSVVIHPVVGKVVEAAGELVAADFRRRFGPE